MEVSPDSSVKATRCAMSRRLSFLSRRACRRPPACPAPAQAACLRPGHLPARPAAMTSSTDSNPEDEYAATSMPTMTPRIASSPRRQQVVPATSPKQTCPDSAGESRTARTTGNGRYSPVSCPGQRARQTWPDLAHDAAEHPIAGTWRAEWPDLHASRRGRNRTGLDTDWADTRAPYATVGSHAM